MVSIDSKRGQLKDFYKLLSEFPNHKPVTIETKNRENRILNNVNQLNNKYFVTHKKGYDREDLNERYANVFDHSQFKILVNKKKKSESSEENTLRERERESCKSNYGSK